MMVCVVMILVNAFWRCTQVLRGRIAIRPDTMNRPLANGRVASRS
jgi:hypothetical protein